MSRRPKAIANAMSATSATHAPSDREEQIRRRAYELYEQRARKDGRELDDWLQAEAEARQTKAVTEAA